MGRIIKIIYIFVDKINGMSITKILKSNSTKNNNAAGRSMPRAIFLMRISILKQKLASKQVVLNSSVVMWGTGRRRMPA